MRLHLSNGRAALYHLPRNLRSASSTASHTIAMSAAAFIRSASRARVAPFARRAFVQKPVFQRAAFSAGPSRLAGADVDAHDPHHEESFEDFTARYDDPERVGWEGSEDAMAGGEMAT